MTIRFALLLSLIAISSGCDYITSSRTMGPKNNAPKYRLDEDSLYHLYFNIRHDQSYEADEFQMMVSPVGNMSGENVIYVNDSPLFIGSTGVYLRVSGFLEQEENEFEIKGRSIWKTFAKLYKLPNNVPASDLWESEYELIDKEKLEKFEDSNSFSLDGVEDRYAKTFEEFPQSGPAREQMEERLKTWIEEIDAAMRDNNGKFVANALWGNSHLLPEQFVENASETFKHLKSQTQKTFSRKRTKVTSPKDSIEYFWGKKCVLIRTKGLYSDPPRNEFPLMWKVEDGKQVIAYEPLRIVLIDGKFVVLQ